MAKEAKKNAEKAVSQNGEGLVEVNDPHWVHLPIRGTWERMVGLFRQWRRARRKRREPCNVTDMVQKEKEKRMILKHIIEHRQEWNRIMKKRYRMC